MKRLSNIKIKLKTLFLCAFLGVGLLAFTGCSGSGEAVNNGKLNIVCTTYPQYNWIQNTTISLWDCDGTPAILRCL